MNDKTLTETLGLARTHATRNPHANSDDPDNENKIQRGAEALFLYDDNLADHKNSTLDALLADLMHFAEVTEGFDFYEALETAEHNFIDEGGTISNVPAQKTAFANWVLACLEEQYSAPTLINNVMGEAVHLDLGYFNDQGKFCVGVKP